MRTIIGTILCFLILSCTNKSNRIQSSAGSADCTAEIVLTEKSDTQDRDTVIYELPECLLWYTKTLPEEYKGKDIRMWTEHENYWENVKAINVFVANPTENPLDFGRHWNLYIWHEREWITPRMKVSMIIWEDDLFIGNKDTLLYCFRFPIGDYYYLPKGKYRLVKTFRKNDEKITLMADFNICNEDIVPAKTIGEDEENRLDSK